MPRKSATHPEQGSVSESRTHFKTTDCLLRGVVRVSIKLGVPVQVDAVEGIERLLVGDSYLSRIDDLQNGFVNCVVAYEDKRYWSHSGVDFVAICAVIMQRRNGGASTIAMQLARQAIATPHRLPYSVKIKRKAYETAAGHLLVRRYGHRKVLYAWLFSIPFGTPRIIGIEQAAKDYFGKHHSELDELHGILLAERATIHTGRYFLGRTTRLVKWAIRRGLVPQELAPQWNSRFEEMVSRVPGPVNS